MRRAILMAMQAAVLAAPAAAAVPDEILPGNLKCQQVPERGWTVCASTVRLPLLPARPDGPPVFFHPRHAADGDPRTVWAPGQRGPNLGTMVELRFAGVRRLRYLNLWNGDGRSPGAWADSGRLRQLLIQTSDGLTDRVTPVDRNGVQMIVLSRPVATLWVRLIATAVTPGRRYPAFALGDVQPSDGTRELVVPVVGGVAVDDWLPPPGVGDPDDAGAGGTGRGGTGAGGRR